jgi:carbamoylphosphate synthase large subunit
MTNIEQEAIICIAAGRSQLPLILSAKKLGYIIIAIDKDPSAIGLKYVDHYIQKSTYSFNEMLYDLSKIKEKYRVSGVLNRSSGLPVIVASKISEYFEIPSLPIDSADKIVHKYKLRESCPKNIPAPEFKIIKKGSSLNDFVFDYPVVIKPSLSLIGKSGVTLVKKKEDIEKAIILARKATMDETILIEEYLPGKDYSLISLVSDSELLPICLLEEINKLNLSDGTISGQGFKTFSDSKDNQLQKEAHQLAKDLIDSYKISRSPLLINFRQDQKGKLHLIEIHLDFGGDLLIEGFYPKALSYDFLETALNVMAGGDVPNLSDYIKPTAILFKKGDSINRKRGFKTFSANTQEELEQEIIKAGI